MRRETEHLVKGRYILCQVPKIKYSFIKKYQADFSIKAMCRVLQVAHARSGCISSVLVAIR